MDIIQTLQSRLNVLMREYRIKAAPLARAADLNESAVRDILRGRSKNPGIVTLQKIAAVLDLRPSVLFDSGEMWPVIGEIKGGDEVLLREFGGGADQPQEIESPFCFYSRRRYKAVLVADRALAPLAYPGDYLIFDPSIQRIAADDLGRPCVCVLSSGENIIAIPGNGDDDGLFHLTPVNFLGASHRNVDLKQASRIEIVLPEFFASTTPPAPHAATSTVHEEQAAFDHGRD